VAYLALQYFFHIILYYFRGDKNVTEHKNCVLIFCTIFV
jgi:hypothetical protein